MSGDPGDDGEDSSADTFVRQVALAPPASPPAAERDRNGEVLGHFELRRMLGRGGMGVVYEARDLALRRPVAVKLLRASSVDNAEHRQRFLREARAAAAVGHPNLAAVYEVGEVAGEVFIAMELVEGRSLRAVLEQAGARLPEAESLRIAREIARGLAAAHQAGIVHRDLKPENVMVEAGGGVKILDFGLAKMDPAGGGETATSDLATSEGRILGSPGYMSPEQARGLPVDARSDVFACGVVLYELLAGERPFQGKTLMDVVAAIVRDPEPPLLSKNPAASRALAGVLSCCLDKDPGRRFADAGRLLAALEAMTGSEARPPIRWPWRRWFALHTRLSLVYAMPPFILAIGAAAWITLRPARPQGSAITDLPLPTSSRSEAIDAYRIAVQSLRDADWRQAERSLRRAVALDPSMAAAHLRLAMVLVPPTLRAPPPEAQAAYGEAARLRGALPVRDRRLLIALEPVLHADPVDLQEAVSRLRDLTEDYPRDAELFFLLAIYRILDAPELRLQAAQRAVELDPEYAGGWQVVGRALEERGQRDRACEVYRSILGWWGQSKPKSVAADEARGRARALGCGAAP